MQELLKFLNRICKISGQNNVDNITISQAREVVTELNNFLYTNYDGIGKTFELDEYREYFSDYHVFWEKHYKDIICPTIDLVKCEQVADIFHDIYMKNRNAFYSLYSMEGLSKEEVCKIRYYTATQDFRGSREFKDFAQIYKEDPSIFDKENIVKNPSNFISKLGIHKLSQTDKRLQYAQKSAEFLIAYNCEPYDLLKKMNSDLIDLREKLVSSIGMGFGNKKADMFIRDMVVLDIWDDFKNFDKLNVASDRNTIKVALRSGILKTEIPLVSSFLDIFDYQYGLLDETSAQSWRKVWEIWNKKYPKECIEGPCLLDYLVYRIIGREFCNERLYIYECESEHHIFAWHSPRNKTCQICAKSKEYPKAKIINRILPCQDERGYVAIENNKYVYGDEKVLDGIKECPLKAICNPMDKKFIKFNGPKSISILGQTGWESARVRRFEGGGGLMA